MPRFLKNLRRTTVLLAAMAVVCVALSVLRWSMTGTKMYVFLNWNLFLAFLPWLFAAAYRTRPALQGRWWALGLVLAAWLLFFPNAPYILTDLFHLRLHSAMPIWFDLVMVVSYAWTGLLFGMVSLFDIEKALGRWLPRVAVTCLSVAVLFLGSFGVYLGRYLRWNSWDIVQQPGALLSDIGDRFLDPMAHPRTWGMTLFFGVLLCMIYFSLRAVMHDREQETL